MPLETIAIASDHAGFDLKSLLRQDLKDMGYDVLDLGTDSPAGVDYPDFADAVVGALKEGKARCGVLICGTGIGMSMAANRHLGVRAASCHNSASARLARRHNDANILALGARLIGTEVARDCLRVFLATAFDGDARHRRRLGKLG